MKLIRRILGAIILWLDRLFSPTPIARDAGRQAAIDQETRSLVLYQFESCPFCVKVRRALKRMALNIELRDANRVPEYGNELVQGGGKRQVPCLKITGPDGSIQWMYESSDIISYLEKRFI